MGILGFFFQYTILEKLCPLFIQYNVHSRVLDTSHSLILSPETSSKHTQNFGSLLLGFEDEIAAHSVANAVM